MISYPKKQKTTKGKHMKDTQPSWFNFYLVYNYLIPQASARLLIKPLYVIRLSVKNKYAVII